RAARPTGQILHPLHLQRDPVTRGLLLDQRAVPLPVRFRRRDQPPLQLVVGRFARRVLVLRREDRVQPRQQHRPPDSRHEALAPDAHLALVQVPRDLDRYRQRPPRFRAPAFAAFVAVFFAVFLAAAFAAFFAAVFFAAAFFAAVFFAAVFFAAVFFAVVFLATAFFAAAFLAAVFLAAVFFAAAFLAAVFFAAAFFAAFLAAFAARA